jgi:hypothetical protein
MHVKAHLNISLYGTIKLGYLVSRLRMDILRRGNPIKSENSICIYDNLSSSLKFKLASQLPYGVWVAPKTIADSRPVGFSFVH